MLTVSVQAEVMNYATVSPYTKMQLQEFRVRVMHQYWLIQGRIDRDEWQEKLSQYCEDNKIIVSVCSYCDRIIGVNNNGVGLSHGVCYDCLVKVDEELGEDTEMIKARDELNQKDKMFNVYLRRS